MIGLGPLSLAEEDIARAAGVDPSSLWFDEGEWTFRGTALADGAAATLPVSTLVEGLQALLATPEGRARVYEVRAPPPQPERPPPALPDLSVPPAAPRPAEPYVRTDCVFMAAQRGRRGGLTSAEDRFYENPENWQHR